MDNIKKNGIPASYGIAIGKLIFLKKDAEPIPKYKAENINIELERYENAKLTANTRLEELYQKALKLSGAENAEIFSVHRIMLDDPDFCDETVRLIKTKGYNAEYAVSEASKRFISMLEATGDEYLRARTTDIKDITERLINILLNRSEKEISEGNTILYTDDLTPSEAIQIDRSKVLGFMTAEGSSEAHTAILARTNGIPCIVGCGKLDERYDGCELVMDGSTGEYEISPSAETVEKYRIKMEAEREVREKLLKFKGKETKTPDGKIINLYANIGSISDIETATENDAEGIGLFRTEFIFIGRDKLPSENEQFEIYRTVLQRMSGKKTVIRTLDIGADKHAEYLNLPHEENPALGLRGIRLCLSRPDIFDVQIRALLRASAYGKLSIMFPMITSLWEVREVKRRIDEISKALDSEHIPYDRDIELGIMIETPSAALLSDGLAAEVDFFSIGSNDLTQYTLAADRQNPSVSEYYSQSHEAVLKLIKMTCENAHSAGIWVGICGELASDLNITPKLISLGIDELSVSPPMILPLREKISSGTLVSE